jgi:hypothetical protein
MLYGSKMAKDSKELAIQEKKEPFLRGWLFFCPMITRRYTTSNNPYSQHGLDIV